MKRRRRPTPVPLRLLRMQSSAYGGYAIPPRSIVQLNADWGNDKGRVFRIGYYSRQDGLDCVWLVNEAGEYKQATDQNSIGVDFTILHLSTEGDMYGTNRERFGSGSTDELLKSGVE